MKITATCHISRAVICSVCKQALPTLQIDEKVLVKPCKSCFAASRAAAREEGIDEGYAQAYKRKKEWWIKEDRETGKPTVVEEEEPDEQD